MMVETKALPEIKPVVLVVDDDQSMREILASILRKKFNIYLAENTTEAREILQRVDVQIVLLDVRIGTEDGLVFLPDIKEINDQIEVIVITVLKDIKTAVQAIKVGAFDFINKNFDDEDLEAMIYRALEKQKSAREILYLQEEIKQQHPDDFYFGRSPALQKMRDIADRAAGLQTTVLITGETGTGKELMARYIHRKSHLHDKPFVTINLAAIPSELMESILFGHEKGAFTGAHRLHYGKFELANGGTLFLDEIGELRYDLQAKLLRVLQESEIERIGGNKVIPIRVRLISATNVNLLEKIKLKEFRGDLYYRLNVVPMHLPALRERIEDLPQLMDFFLDRYNKKFNRHIKGFHPEVSKILSTHNWPGNIRELENFVERIVAISTNDMVAKEDIPLEYYLYQLDQSEPVEGEDKLQKSLDAFERSFIFRVLKDSGWNQTRASLKLGVHRKTLEYKIKRLGMEDVILSEKSRDDD
ncbi:MAG: sigma-54-dependent Fis family transcriptional regulator [Deltaproteobacteria bacterium]|nr:MAG: sigma-54-dependent Fis family transcriptional regulator [Deltaproteobacteria bacterium]